MMMPTNQLFILKADLPFYQTTGEEILMPAQTVLLPYPPVHFQ